MRVPCPSCEAVYDIPESMLAGGPRRLRCARCATEWHAQPPAAAPEPAVAPAAAAAPPVAAAAATTTRPPRRAVPLAKPKRSAGGLALGLAWAATLLVVAGLGAGFWVWPDAVTEAFPPAARLYAALGVEIGESALSTSPAR